MLRISPALANLPLINSNALSDLQGNLKDLTAANFAKLEQSVTKHGFFVPMFVWFEPDTGTPYTLDGNQRLRYVRRTYPDGVDLPYVKVEAADRAQAKQKILLISSQYGTVTKDGFDEFMSDLYTAAGEVATNAFVEELTTFDSLLDIDVKEQEDPDDQPGKIEFSPELGEKSNYVVLKFDTEQDWLQFTSFIELQTVASTQSNGKQRSTGVGRVLSGPDVLNQLLNR